MLTIPLPTEVESRLVPLLQTKGGQNLIMLGKQSLSLLRAGIIKIM